MNFAHMNFGPDFENRTAHVYEGTNEPKWRFGITHGTSLQHGPVALNSKGSIMRSSGPINAEEFGGPWEIVSDYCKEWFMSGVDENNKVKPWVLPENVMACQGWINEYSIQMALHNGSLKRI